MAYGDTQAPVVDLTLIFDPAEVWPDPETCPDWPIIRGYNPDNIIVGRGPAQTRLDLLRAALGRGAALRAPTPDEAEALRLRYFQKYDSPVGPWSIELELRGWGIRDRVTENQARTIVEALHVRGYLRKLDERAARGRIEGERRKTASAQARLDLYEQRRVTVAEDLAALAEAEARHKQRLDDEKAFRRCADLRQNHRLEYSEARRAAAELGAEPPEAPAFD